MALIFDLSSVNSLFSISLLSGVRLLHCVHYLPASLLERISIHLANMS